MSESLPKYGDMSLVIRTDFSDDVAWAELKEAIAEPQTEGEFLPSVAFVEDRIYDGLSVERLLELRPQGSVGFLADGQTFADAERPILVVNLYDWVEELEDTADQGKGPLRGATFRVVPSAMWSVENNLSLSNMDWEDFAGRAGEGGVFRGFA